jgi:hypothetical protein
MIKISVEVKSDTSRFGVSVQAQSIERALQIVKGQYPDKYCKVRFPIDAETFFVEGSVAGNSEASGRVAA